MCVCVCVCACVRACACVCVRVCVSLCTLTTNENDKLVCSKSYTLDFKFRNQTVRPSRYVAYRSNETAVFAINERVLREIMTVC